MADSVGPAKSDAKPTSRTQPGAEVAGPEVGDQSGILTFDLPTLGYDRIARFLSVTGPVNRATLITGLQRSVGNHVVQRLIASRAVVTRDEDGSNSPPPPQAEQSAPAEREREVDAVTVDGKTYVLYQTEVRSGGSSSWLANNPGNMDYTADTAAWGAYEGKKLPWGAHRFAIFPNEQTGLQAVTSFLRKYQTTRDITLMMNLFAPAGDQTNDPTRYSQRVADALKVPVTTLVKDLSDEQIQVFAKTIQSVEGWTVGTTTSRDDPSLPEAVRNR